MRTSAGRLAVLLVLALGWAAACAPPSDGVSGSTSPTGVVTGAARPLPDIDPDPEYGLPRRDAADELAAWAGPPAQASSDVAGLGGDASRPWGTDPLTGEPLTERGWAVRYTTADGSPRWPPNGGAVAGTRVAYDDLARFVEAYGADLDRIGGEGGQYLGVPPGAAWRRRSLAPYSLGLAVHRYRVTGALPGGWSVEVSTIAPAFGQPGGGTQVRFIDAQGQPVSVADLTDPAVGLLTER